MIGAPFVTPGVAIPTKCPTPKGSSEGDSGIGVQVKMKNKSPLGKSSKLPLEGKKVPDYF